MYRSTNTGLRTRSLPSLASWLICGISACGTATPRPPGAVPVEIRSAWLPGGPPPPQRGLPVPSLDVKWTPPMLVAGDVAALAQALAEHEVLALHAGPRWGSQAGTDTLTPVLEAMAPDAEIAAVSAGRAAALVGDRPLPVERLDRGMYAAPRYRHSEVSLADDWNRGRELTANAAAVLVIDEAPIDLDAWSRLPARAQGGCTEAMDALAVGQEHSLAQLERFLDHADTLLLRLFRAELNAVLPALEDDLEGLAKDGRIDGECISAHRELLHEYRACGEDPKRCRVAPRLFLLAGARVGMAEPASTIGAQCVDTAGRDVRAELRAAAQDVVHAAEARLDSAWMALAERLGMITEVHATLEDICTPRRRRFTQSDLQAARHRLARIGEALASDELDRPGATWHFASVHGSTLERFHAPGVGQIVQVAHYDGGPGSPGRRILAESRALRQFVLDRAMCRTHGESRPLVAMVIPAEARQPAFLGYFFDEELSCGDLGPRATDVPPSASGVRAGTSVPRAGYQHASSNRTSAPSSARVQ